MRMRACAIILTTTLCFVTTSRADSIADRAFGDAPVLATKGDGGVIQPIAAPALLPGRPVTAAAMPAVAPVAVVTPAPAAAARAAGPATAPSDTGDRRDRTRVLSYILLQSLQGAGPFAGGR